MRMGSYLILNVILFIGCYTIVMCSPDALVSDLEQDPAEVHQSDGVIAFIQDPDEQVPDELDRGMDAVKAYVKAMHKATRKGCVIVNSLYDPSSRHISGIKISNNQW